MFLGYFFLVVSYLPGIWNVISFMWNAWVAFSVATVKPCSKYYVTVFTHCLDFHYLRIICFQHQRGSIFMWLGASMGITENGFDMCYNHARMGTFMLLFFVWLEMTWHKIQLHWPLNAVNMCHGVDCCCYPIPLPLRERE